MAFCRTLEAAGFKGFVKIRLFFPALRHESGRQSAQFAFPKQKAHHMFFNDLNGFRIRGAERAFIDDRRESFLPAPPAFTRNIFEDALANCTRKGWTVECFGLLIQN